MRMQVGLVVVGLIDARRGGSTRPPPAARRVSARRSDTPARRSGSLPRLTAAGKDRGCALARTRELQLAALTQSALCCCLALAALESAESKGGKMSGGGFAPSRRS